MRDNIYVTSLVIDWASVSNRSVYPFSVPSIASLAELDLNQPITLFCGENGTGKSTLLEALSIAYGLNPEGGTRNYTFTVHDTHSELCDHVRLLKNLFRPYDSFFVRSDTMFNLISEMDVLGDDARHFDGRSLHSVSHGEGILALVSRRFRGGGFYVLDEPETGLSQLGQIALLAEIVRLAQAGSQLIIATHSPILLSAPNAVIYQFDDEVHRVAAEETLEWNVLKRFLENPERMLAAFMDENT